MASLSINNLSKSFGEFLAVDNVSVEIPDGKLVCLLGPSGCGKTTLLRLVAGLEIQTEGSVVVDGIDQSSIPSHNRDFGMVFQSLALFPHLSVAENIAYPLRIRGVGVDQQQTRVTELLELVKLQGIENRRINQLSGGQRQRVAIARALTINPRLFLLDEPLSALDAKLREHMQVELRLIQNKLNITTILVTHDQREAMTMADIVIVMDKGKVLQIDPPSEIYRSPVNSFVANFISMCNLIPCRFDGGRQVSFFGQAFTLSETDTVRVQKGDEAVLSIRPEDVEILPTPEEGKVTGRVTFIRDLGASIEISVGMESGPDMLSICTPTRRPNVGIGQTVGLKFYNGRITVMTS